MGHDDLTPLERALSAHGGALSPQFFICLLSSELYLLAQGDPDAPQPQIFDTSDGRIVLAFDRAQRLARFRGADTPYLMVSGRQLVSLLAQNKLGLGLNFDQSAYAITIPFSAIDWLSAQPLSADEISVQLDQLSPPDGVSHDLLQALDQQLALMVGLAQMAYLVSANSDQLILVIVDPAQGAQGAIKTALAEAIALLGDQSRALDIMFVAPDDPICVPLSRIGLRFDLPKPASLNAMPPPGSDPSKPPKLR